MITATKFNLGFTGRIVVGGDLGASKEGGSGRVFLFDEDTGENIGKALPEKGSVFVCPGGVGKDEENYAKGVIKLISKLVSANKKTISQRPETDQIIAGFVAAAPAQTTFIDGRLVAPVVANIKSDDGTPEGKPIRADFTDVQMGLATKGMKLSKDFKNFVVNDMNMWTLQTATAHKDELKEGFKFATFINGGGFGAGFGEVLNVNNKNYLHIRATEEGHVKAGAGTLEAENCSSPALIKNWGEELGLQNETLSDEHKTKLNNKQMNTTLDVLMALGNSEIVTSKENTMTIKLKAKEKTPEERKFLRDSISVLKDSNILKVKEKAGIAEITVTHDKKEQAQQASRSSVDKYIDGLAFLAHVHACDGLNKIFLIGPLNSKGIANYVGGTEKLGQMVTEKTFEKLDAAGANIAKLNNFEVTVNKDIEDSQQALKTLSKGNFMKNTGNSYMIGTEKL